MNPANNGDAGELAPSLRAYLAGQALCGLLANGRLIATKPHPSGHPLAPRTVSPETFAAVAVELADALLAELGKGGEL